MSGLQEAFYIVSIVFYAIMFILIIALVVVAALMIRSKINRIHAQIEAKLNSATNLAEKGGEIAALAAGAAVRRAKRAIRKR